jgi:hypothetical protein
MIRSPGVAALGVAVAAGVWLAGCDSPFDSGEQRYPAPLAAVSAPESLLVGDPVSVRVYSLGYNCSVETLPSEFVAVNDTTFELLVLQTGATPGLGCPSVVNADEFVLPHAPSGRFHLRCVGADTIDVLVHGGAQPAAVVRHTFRLVNPLPPVGTVGITLLGCHSEGPGRLVCGDTLATLAVGMESATFVGPCTLGGTQYLARIEQTFVGETSGTLYCRQPWQTLIRY